MSDNGDKSLVVRRGDGSEAGDVQSELDDLQRRYRRMELGKRTFAEDSQNAIRMQRHQIQKLKKDNERLKEDLAMETRQARHSSNLSASAQIGKLQDQADMYSRKIAAEKRKVDDLDKRIKSMQDEILAQRRDMGGYNASKERNMKIQKDIRIKENQLDKALVKYNAALAHNKKLRETIDNLRRERKVFDDLFKGLEDDLAEKKRHITHIIQVTKEAYDARDDAQREMVGLKKRADEEQARFEEKWNRLGALIERDRRTKDFLKGDGGNDASGSRALLDGEEDADPAEEEERKLRRRVEADKAKIEESKASITVAKQKVEHYESTLRDIAAATNQPDVSKLVQDFEEAENTNFALFNRVNELSNQIEQLEESCNELQAEIDKYQDQAGSNTDISRKKMLQGLEAQLGKTNDRAAFYEEKHKEALSTVDVLKEGIAAIYAKLKCTDPHETLGSDGVTESNMMAYLGIIEARTAELLTVYDNDEQDVPAEDEAPAKDVVAPSFTSHLDDSKEEEDVQPLSITALVEQAKQANAGAGAPVSSAETPADAGDAAEPSASDAVAAEDASAAPIGSDA